MKKNGPNKWSGTRVRDVTVSWVVMSGTLVSKQSFRAKSVFVIPSFTMEVAQQENFAAMRQKRIDQMAKMHHKISSPKLREMLKEVRLLFWNYLDSFRP